MGKFDGMDPKLVRDLLAEVKQAAGELRTIEGRVAQVMSGAGLATRAMHRPGQVADAIDTMSKDVNTRLTVLEKREDAPRGADAGKDPVRVLGGNDEGKTEPKHDPKPATGSEDEPKEERGDDRSRYDNPRADDPKPDVKTDDKPDVKTDDKPDVKTDDKPDVKTDDKPDVKTDDKPDVKTEDKPDPKGDDKPDPKSDDVTASDENKNDKKDDPVKGDEPKDDERDSRRDRGAEPPLDPTKPQVVEVDGVKVLQVPLDPPTAEELEELIRNIEDIQPQDTPTLSGDTTPGQIQPGGKTVDAGGLSTWANDGSDVVSADAKPIDPAALKALIENIRDVQPMDMPGVEVPKGEMGNGQWAPQDIKPDGPPGSLDPGNPTTTQDTSGSPTATSGTPAQPVSYPPTTPDTPAANPPVTSDAYGNQSTPSQPDGNPTTGDAYGNQTTPSQPVGNQPSDTSGNPAQPVGNQPSDVSGDQGNCAKTDANDTAPGNKADPANPATSNGRGDTGTGTGTPETSGDRGQTAPAGDRTGTGYSTPAGDRTGTEYSSPAAGGSAGPQQWADDGSDVVSVDADPLDPAALKTLMDNVRDVQPMDMPSVEVPKGEWGKGEWVPEDIRPDGPPGAVEPGERSR
ncbi:hypothetical protein [Nonomuraea endophytica]|uniref:Uncharacterized protein n=1 Tax=Nonomuraea endophytica TaxID=714136 RepID=A0A7W8EIS5_9ACTN|nr:hypothetical protein [Nonomuraea endophytica]MBB5079947.1 hypothetical protein [Nonomuraea endophytica]